MQLVLDDGHKHGHEYGHDNEQEHWHGQEHIDTDMSVQDHEFTGFRISTG